MARDKKGKPAPDRHREPVSNSERLGGTSKKKNTKDQLKAQYVRPEKPHLALTTFLQDRALTPVARSVGHALYWHFNLKTGRCDPGISRLAIETQYTVRQVKRGLETLKCCGYVSWTRHGGTNWTNSYRLHWTALVSFAEQWEARARGQGGDKNVTTLVTRVSESGDRNVTQTLEGTLEDNSRSGPPSSASRKRDDDARKDETPESQQPPPCRADIPALLALQGGKVDTPSSASVAKEKAQGRWEADLLDKAPDLYQSALERLTPEMMDAATHAELKRKGTGYPTLLAALKSAEAA